MKQFYFILGTGRSGTYSIFKTLQKNSVYKVHHEYKFEFLLRLGTLKFHHKINKEDVICGLKQYRKELEECQESKIIDISNALPLLLDELKVVFPEARFLWISRNGYKVVSSFYHKFTDLMYPFEGIKELEKYLFDMDGNELPFDKRICRPLYISPLVVKSRFKNICYHWSYYEDIAIDRINILDKKLKFEDLVSNELILKDFISFLEIKWNKNIENDFKIPTNVHIAKNLKLDKELSNIFYNICGNTMNILDYKEIYDVEY